MSTPENIYAFPSGLGMRGMTLRDYFAGQAVMGIYAGGSHRDVAASVCAEQRQHELSLSSAQVGHIAENLIATMAYAVADAMLAQRTPERTT